MKSWLKTVIIMNYPLLSKRNNNTIIGLKIDEITRLKLDLNKFK